MSKSLGLILTPKGLISLGEDPARTQNLRKQYRAKHYHQTSDSVEGLEETWDLEGTVQIARWVQVMIELLAQETKAPEFLEVEGFSR